MHVQELQELCRMFNISIECQVEMSEWWNQTSSMFQLRERVTEILACSGRTRASVVQT